MTFAEKIASYPGLVRYHIMDTGDPSGQAGNTWGHDIASFIGATEVNPVHSVLDTGVLASGNPSLKMTVPSQSSSGASGQWTMRYSADTLTQFGAGETFNVQWMEKRSAFMCDHVYLSDGFKHSIIGRGDSPLCDPGAPTSQYCSTSSSSLKLVMQNQYNYGIPKMYNDQDVAFEQYVAAFSDFDLQPHQGTAPAGGTYCSYVAISGGQYNRTNCFAYLTGLASPSDPTTRWCTMTVQVTLGAISGASFVGSNIKAWGAWTGDAAFKWLDYNTDLPANGTDKYGRIWLLPYQTNKQTSEVHDVAYVWYANVIVASGAAQPTYLTTDEIATGSQLAVVLR